MKNLLLTSTVFGLLLIGAGCNNANSQNGPHTKSAGEVTSTTNTTTQATPVSEIPEEIDPYSVHLNASVIGKKTIRISFTVPDETLIDAQSYRLLLSKKEEPTQANASNWYTLGLGHTEKDWTVQATGENYVRVCVVYDGKCDAYSNSVKVELQ